jgi:ABC-type phosphate transport system substrate-binding protein
MRLLALFALALCAAACGRAQDAAIVVNKDTKVTSLTADDFKNILLGKKLKFEDGTNIKLAILADGPIHEKVIRDFTQRTTDQFDRYWKRQVFSGQGIMPQQFKTDAELIAYVAETPGGLGYVGSGSVTPAVVTIEIK